MTTRTCAALLAALSICGCATTNNPNIAANPPGGPSRCLTSAGSAIPTRSADISCRSYSKADIDLTGRTTVAGALSELDPGLTVTR
jgi:hypothetical protein